MNLTDEQLEIVDAAHGHASISVIARAGTGKTTTACAIALDQPDTNFAYLAFNKKVSDEAKAKFPKHVKVLTAHSAAFRAIGKHYKERICRSPWKLKTDIAERFHAAYSDMGGSESVEDLALFATLETIDTFCASADIQIEERAHVPDGPYKKEIIAALARGLWTAMCDTSDWVPITDDCYLKMWQLAVMRNPASARTILGADKILFDEGQDASPAMLDITQRSGAPIILIGDPRQCLPGESLIETAAGTKAISEIRAGDHVRSGMGNGHVGLSLVTKTNEKHFVGELVVIETESGATIRSTPDHTHFAEYSTARHAVESHFVYLMERSDLGFRVGRAYGSPAARLSGSGFIGRARTESADRTWVLKVCTTAEDAAFYEQFYSLTYGIPTSVFKTAGRKLFTSNVARIFEALDTRGRARKLLADIGMAYGAPHYVPQSSNRVRKNFRSMLCGVYRPGRENTQHRFSISGSDPDDRARLERAGLPVRAATKHHGGWRIEGANKSIAAIRELAATVTEIMSDTVVLESAKLAAGTALRLMPAGNCHIGMDIFIHTDGRIVKDRIKSVSRQPFDGLVYDIDVEQTHNFIANGVVTHNCIYGWRGAVNAFERVDYPEFSLTQSWRFGPEIAQPANDILTVLKEFYLIDGRGGPGRVIVDDNEFFPNAVIARTNGGLVEEAVRIADDGGSIHIVGGTEHIFGWLKAAYALWSKRRAQHPAFSMFKSWDMLKDASGQAIGKSYKPFVDIVEQYRSQIPDLLMKLETSHTTAEEADTVLSTVSSV
jgi:hypothetical protein